MHHIMFGKWRVLQDQAEEVRLRLERLIGDHHRAFLHHSLFDLRCDFMKLLSEAFIASLQASQLFRHVPEANVRALRLRDKLKTFAAFHDWSEIFRSFKELVDMLLETFRSLSTPHEPKLVNVSSATTLNVFISSIIFRVVEFIFLEQVSCVWWMTRRQNALMTTKECWALLRTSEHLMRIPSNRVRSAEEQQRTGMKICE